MYTEDDYILEQFNSNFIKKNSNPIVIYGIGVHTKELLDRLNSSDKKRICGLMDAAKTGETIYDLKVLSYEEVAKINNVSIVIIARQSVINIIYRRIENFVNENSIYVYSVNGEKIQSKHMDNTPKDCFMLHKNDLLKQIDCVDTVSFDIFDTLICRCVLRPTDVFRMIEKSNFVLDFDFSKERIKAETDVTAKNYNIYDIYNQLQVNTGISDEMKDFLIMQEFNAERKLIYARDEMISVLNYAIKHNKKVYLISDMYWPEKYIKELLDINAITGYLELFVSTDYKTSKSETLYEIVRDKFCIEPSNWLHIGDNEYSDILSANKLGIQTYKIYSTIDMFEQSIYSDIVGSDINLEENVIISRFASIAYNNPFDEYEFNGKLNITDDKKLIKLLVAPVVYKYINWLIQGIKENDEQLVIFPSRDGFVLRKVYEKLKIDDKTLPPSIYFYTSRRAAITAAISDKKDIIRELEIPDERSLCEIIKARFDIDIDGINQIDEIDELGFEKIIEQARIENKGLITYVNSQRVNDYSRVAFVDFVAAGTIQKYLQDVLRREFHGYYFLKRTVTDEGYDKLLCDSLYKSSLCSDNFSTNLNIYKYYYFLENIITAPEPSFMKYGASGDLLFYSEKRDSKQIDCLNEILEVIEKECISIFDIFKNTSVNNNEVAIYDKILGFFSKDYINLFNSDVLNFINIDEFMGKRVDEINR